MPKPNEIPRERRGKYRRARIRNFFFTVGPHRVTGGKISRRHLARDLVVREVEIVSPDWPAAFDGLRVGHVSDFHLGELITIERGLEAVELLASYEPDFVACTGDVVDLHHQDAPPLLAAIGAMDAPLGAALVLGNHDELHCPDTIQRYAREAGLHVLDDEAISIGHNGGQLVIAGIGWANSVVECAAKVERVHGDPTHLLLAHNPRAFVRASELGIPLTLSGHTHGGQVALPKRPNTNLALTHRHSAGVFEESGAHLFVTAGVGSWFPLRLNCPAEVAVVTIRSGETAGDES